MDLEFKAPSLERFYSPNHRPQSISPVWSDKEKPEEDVDLPTSDGDDQASVQEIDVENSNGCNESFSDVLQWENGIGTLAGSELKFRMNEHGDVEVITDAIEMSNTENPNVKTPTENNVSAITENGNLSPEDENSPGVSGTAQSENFQPIEDKSDCSILEKLMSEQEQNFVEKNSEKDSVAKFGKSASELHSIASDSNTEKDNPQNNTEVEDANMKNEIPSDNTHDQTQDTAISSPNQSYLEDDLTTLDPVLHEDMAAVLYEREDPLLPDSENNKKEKPVESPAGIVENAPFLTETDPRTVEEKVTPEPGKCIICGRPSRLANRFCSRQCLGRNAAITRRANQLALSGKKAKSAKKRSLSRPKHHEYNPNMPHPNDVLTVVHDESSGKRNDLKIKIRWSSASNENIDESYSPELREGSKRKAAAATVNYSGTRGSRRKRFNWSNYLSEQNAVAAPPGAFEELIGRDPFPKENRFQLGMALEGVDPEHEALICPLFVAEIRGCRIRLSFCGYSEAHDFWSNVDNPLLFPCGFCQETGRNLEPPKGYPSQNFDWSDYVVRNRLVPAPKDVFTQIPNQKALPTFCAGEKLEAVDKQNPDLVCVATVEDIIGDKVLIHFDGWSHDFDYWCNANSQHLHPAGWCQKEGKELSPPKDYPASKKFSWDSYLMETRSSVANASAFCSKQSHQLQSGMKLEVVDPRNKIVVRVATIVEIDGFSAKIHFDGWSDMYDFLTHVENEDLHPVGWCANTGHPLQPPVSLDETSDSTWQTGGCPIPGCTGIGHIRGAKFQNHYSEFGCPYSPQNLTKEHIKDRLSVYRPRRSTIAQEEDYLNFDDPDVMEADLPTKTARVPGRKRSNSSSYVPERKRTRGSLDNNKVYPYAKIERNSTHIAESVGKWSVEDVAKFVEEITTNPTHGKIFMREEIDGRALLMLAQSDIFRVLNIKLGPAVKIYNAILNMKEGV